MRFLSNVQVLVDINFIACNTYIDDPTNLPANLPFSKTAYVGDENTWYPCEKQPISYVTAALNAYTPLLQGEQVQIVCEFVGDIPALLLEDV